MRTFSICLTLLISILGAASILKPPHVTPPADQSLKDTSRLSKPEIKEAFEKAANAPECLSSLAGNIKKVVVTDVRANDAENLFAIYCDLYLKNGEIRHTVWGTLKRDEFGIWKLDTTSPENFEIREKQ